MRTSFHLTTLVIFLIGLTGKGLAQYADGPIDLRMWVSQSYVSTAGNDAPGEPAEHRWDWAFEDNLSGPLGSIPGCVEYNTSTYTGGWYNHPTKLIKSYLGAVKTPSTFNWVGGGANASSYWEEDVSGNCHYNSGDEAICILGSVGSPVAIRSVVPPHTYGETELFSAGGCSLGARVRVFYTCPAPASANGPSGTVVAGTSARFTAAPPQGSTQGGWASGVDFDYELETAPGSGAYALACEDCPGDVDITMPTVPGVYRMRVRAEYRVGRPSVGYVELSIEVEAPANGAGLPSPWIGATVGEGTGQYDYNSSNETFQIKTTTTNFDLAADNFGFIFRELCGDGAIVIKVENIDGPGYGGLAIRETNAPGAKGAGLYTELTPILRWEQRLKPNGLKLVRTFTRPSPQWLKLERWGNWIFAYTSSDGRNFLYLNGVNIEMNQCVNVGFGAFSYIPEVSTIVTFKLESFTGGPALRPNSPVTPFAQAEAGNLNLEPQLFPNPATNDITIEMGGVIEQATTLRLRNQLGQVIEQRRLDVPAEQMRWEVSSLNPGLYIIEIQTEGLPPKVLRFMKR